MSQDPTALADRLHSAAIHLLRRVRREDEATGLTAARLSALSVVVFAGPVTVSGLAAAEQVSVPTISRLIKAMEDDGLVVRERDASDGRMVWVHATDEGARILREGRRRRVAALAEALQALPDRDLERLDDAVALIGRILATDPEADDDVASR